MLAATPPPKLWQSKLSPDIAKYPLEAKITVLEASKHCREWWHREMRLLHPNCTAVAIFKIAGNCRLQCSLFAPRYIDPSAAFISWSCLLLKNTFVHLASRKAPSWLSSTLTGISTGFPFLIPSFSWPLNIRVTHTLPPHNSSLFTHFLGDLIESHDFSKTFICFPHSCFQILLLTHVSNSLMIPPPDHIMGISKLICPKQKSSSSHPTNPLLPGFPMSVNDSTVLWFTQIKQGNKLGLIFDSSFLSLILCIQSIRKSCWLYRQIKAEFISFATALPLPPWLCYYHLPLGLIQYLTVCCHAIFSQ